MNITPPNILKPHDGHPEAYGPVDRHRDRNQFTGIVQVEWEKLKKQLEAQAEKEKPSE